MQSLGEILRTRRLEKGITIQTAAQETLISKHHLEALEAEDFSSFPSEAYTIGFLRIYAAYLNVNEGKIITHYRRTVMQNQPAPIEELLHRPSKRWYVWIGVGLLLVLLGVGVFRYIPLFHSEDTSGPTARVAEVHVSTGTKPGKKGMQSTKKPLRTKKQNTKRMNSANMTEVSTILSNMEFVERVFKKGEQLYVAIQKEKYRLIIKSLEKDTVHIIVDNQELSIKKGNNASVDVNKDKKDDLLISVRDIIKDQTVMRVSKALEKPILVENLSRVAEHPYLETFSPIKIKLVFTNPCYIRVKYKSEILETLARNNNTYDWEITEPIYIWATNISAIRITTNKKLLDIEEDVTIVAGLIAVDRKDASIRWFSLK